MNTRRQRKRPGWRQRLRNRCAYRAALVRLIKIGTRRVATCRTAEDAFGALHCMSHGMRWSACWYVSFDVPRTPTCGECGNDFPERPCGNPCNQCPF